MRTESRGLRKMSRLQSTYASSIISEKVEENYLLPFGVLESE